MRIDVAVSRGSEVCFDELEVYAPNGRENLAAAEVDPSVTPDGLVLENASARIVLQDGRIASLFDKTRRVEHVSSEADSARGIFKIQFVRGIEPAGELTSDRWPVKCAIRRPTRWSWVSTIPWPRLACKSA